MTSIALPFSGRQLARADVYGARYLIAFAVTLASVLELVDTSIVNVAIPHMMGNLGATLDEIAWVSTGYIVANVIVLPLTGWLSERLGRRNYYTGSIALFTLASLFCGNATTLESLAAPITEPVLVQGSTPLNRSYTFDNFVTGKSNQIAFQESKRTADADQPVSNPLFLYGPTGLGKTHLMHAIAWRKLQQNPSLRVLLITAETFMRLFVTALKANDTLSFKSQMRNVDLLLVDDLHFVLGKEATQEELLAALDWLSDNQKQIILSADRSPSLFENISDRARSRLLKGASIEIAPTDFELRLAILEAKARVVSRERPGFVLNTEAAHFMAQRIATNTRELEGALNRVVMQSGDGTRPITIESLNLWLADFLRAYDRRVTIEEIKKKTADHYGLKVADLESPNRSRSIVRPRQIAMHLARQLTPRSYPEIGRRFGNRDHTTVMHAVETIQRLTGLDPAFGEEVERLRLSIRNWPIEAPVGAVKPGATAEGDQPQV